MRTQIRERKWILRFAMILTVLLVSFGMCRADAAAKITISKSSITLNKGKSYTLKIRGNKGGITWKAGNKKVATVTSKGKVTARGKGVTMVTATVDGKVLLCSVRVNQPVTKVTISKSTLALTAGQSKQLTAKTLPATASNSSVVWTSSNKKVATVTAKGVVKAVGAGTATITVKAKDGSGKKAACKVTVKKKTAATVNTSVSSGKTNNAQKFLNIIKSYDAQIRADYAAGNPWMYSNSGTANRAKNALKTGGIKKVNCALSARWALQDVGILGDKDRFWSTRNDGIHMNAAGERKIRAACDIISVHRVASELIKDGTLQPGDICCMNGHTNVYAGNGKWYDSGRVGSNGYYKGSTYYFTKLGPVNSVPNKVINYIVRVK